MSGRLWLSLCGLALSCAPVLADKNPAKPLPAKVVAAWTRAGAEVGWIHKYRDGYLVFRARAKKGDVPAFRFSGRPKEGWDKIPAVDRPFGVVLRSDAGNADLKGLSSLKQLESLDLVRTKVTDAGLKHLASLKQLHVLDLRDTKVTDAGLKHLTSLKQLQSLYLDRDRTKVTAEGAKQLQTALPKLRIVR